METYLWILYIISADRPTSILHEGPLNALQEQRIKFKNLQV